MIPIMVAPAEDVATRERAPGGLPTASSVSTFCGMLYSRCCGRLKSVGAGVGRGNEGLRSRVGLCDRRQRRGSGPDAGLRRGPGDGWSWGAMCWAWYDAGPLPRASIVSKMCDDQIRVPGRVQTRPEAAAASAATPQCHQESRHGGARPDGRSGAQRWGAGACGRPVLTFGVMSRPRRDSAAPNCEHAYISV